MNTPTEPIDIAVVGAGPCGLAVGVAASNAGLSSRLFDRGPITSALVGYPTYTTFFSTPEKLEIGNTPFVCATGKPTRREALLYYRRIATSFSLDVRQYEAVVEIEGSDGDFTLRSSPRSGQSNEERLTRARAVALAIGCFHEPNLLGIPGEDDHVAHSFTEGAPYYDQDVVVIGGANSAVEAALELHRAGARVRVVHFGDRFDSGVKPWILSDVSNRVRDGDIAVHWRSRATAVEPDRVRIETRTERDAASDRPTREEVLRADWVFALTGWKPDLGFLERLGIEVDARTGVPAHDPVSMESNVPGLFLAGVVMAGYDANKIFIENGRDHGERIVVALTARTVRSWDRSRTGSRARSRRPR